MKKNKHFKKENAITLIALIITVIIMLILVAVTISILVKSNIIGIAENAADKTKSAYEKESSLGGKITIGGVEYDGINDYLQKKCNHKYGEWTVVKEPTLAENGKRYRICTKCNLKQTEKTVVEECEENAHTYGEWEIEKEATCVEKGSKSKTCTTCGKTVTEEIAIDESKHTLDSSGNCTQEGCDYVKPEFSMAFGTIEVVWIDKNNNIIEEPLAPVLNESMMTPVKWTNDEDLATVTTTEKTDTSWYDYEAATSIGDNTESKWANVQVKPTASSTASYFVWVPRYAYRIIYYNSEDLTEDTTVVTGYCDGRGLVDAAGEANNTFIFDSGIETVTDEETGKSYIVHPAFMDDTSSGYSHGGWTEDLAGIWVAKYEMSGKSSALKSTPDSSAYVDVNIANMYNYSKSYSETLKSHLMKNSEWGAVAYLTHSQYGRNAVEPSSATSKTTASGGIQTSTTGNTYGIYGMSGGALEYLAAYNTEYSREGEYYGGTNSYKPASGTHFAYTLNGESDEYATAYTNSGSSSNVYATGKIGDATKEVFDGSNPTWHGNNSRVMFSTYPFFQRGGIYNSLVYAGVFNFDFNSGVSGTNLSFRVVCQLEDEKSRQ